jgi:CHAD domain-containing protein
VAIRKIRSLIAQLKGVFPHPITKSLKSDFGSIARRSNRLRDLDVYLLNRGEYEGLLPPFLRSGLGAMFEDFAVERGKTQNAFAEYLNSPEHGCVVERLEGRLRDVDLMGESSAAGLPVRQLAAKVIGKRHRAICRLAMQLDGATTDDELHGMRIECKKLRYLLEIFAEVLRPADLPLAVKRLRRLQDTLGTFNDLTVQQVTLTDYLESKQRASGVEPALAASIGGLIATLHQRHLAQREAALRQVDKFCSPRVYSVFARLCQNA